MNSFELHPTHPGDYQGDGKYSYTFDYKNDSGSRRKLSIETRIYSEEVTGKSAGGYPAPYLVTLPYRSWYTVLYINVYLEYYSFGSKRWYRRDEPRNIKYDIDVTGSAKTGASNNGYIEYTKPPICSPSFNGLVTNYNGGDYQLVLGNGYIQADSPSLFNWNYEIKGNISAYISDDPGHKNVVSSTDVSALYYRFPIW